jgi:hypothetical protein
MRIRLLARYTDHRGNFEPGDLVDLPDGEARVMLARGAAEAVDPAPRDGAGRPECAALRGGLETAARDFRPRPRSR